MEIKSFPESRDSDVEFGILNSTPLNGKIVQGVTVSVTD